MKIIPGEIKTGELHSYLLGAVAPRPICFASTLDKDDNPNLSPFSFFNVFGSNPTTLIFSPARRVRDNTVKHTLLNIQETKEVVINVVSYAMVQQASLSSCEYPKGVDEFEKSGFTKLTHKLRMMASDNLLEGLTLKLNIIVADNGDPHCQPAGASTSPISPCGMTAAVVVALGLRNR